MSASGSVSGDRASRISSKSTYHPCIPNMTLLDDLIRPKSRPGLNLNPNPSNISATQSKKIRDDESKKKLETAENLHIFAKSKMQNDYYKSLKVQ